MRIGELEPSPPRPWLRRSRRSRGRWQLGSVALPMLELTVRGRRSGRLRRTSLPYVPDGQDMLVVGPTYGLRAGGRPAAVVFRLRQVEGA